MARPAPELERLLSDALAHTPPGRCVWVALSGGLDSTLLLTLAAKVCRQAGRPLMALHVNHGLQQGAGAFEAHCRWLCQRLDVPLHVAAVQVQTRDEGVEAGARKARYQAFKAHIPQADSVWLAQHQNDQAETFLLGALRGSGVRGLAAMPYRRQWQGLTLLRPWLSVKRTALEHAAQALDLHWCDDPSNQDTAFDRNRLRQVIMPALHGRWPQAAGSLAQSAALAGEADTLLAEYAADDLKALARGPGCVDASALKAYSPARQRLLVRTLCQSLALPTLPRARLESLLNQLNAAPDAQVQLIWPGGEARVWQDRLYVMAPLKPLPAWQSAWNGEAGVATPLGALSVALNPKRAVTLRFRQGGEMIELAGRGRRDLKRLLQEAGVPPWQRSRVIVVMQGEHCLGALSGPGTVLFEARGAAFSPA
ncbi:tRNA lysidine(34) synthetase TilS [Vreelandella sp. EE22]